MTQPCNPGGCYDQEKQWASRWWATVVAAGCEKDFRFRSLPLVRAGRNEVVKDVHDFWGGGPIFLFSVSLDSQYGVKAHIGYERGWGGTLCGILGAARYGCDININAETAKENGFE